MKLYLLLAVFAWLIVEHWGFFIFFSICVIIFYLKCFGHFIKVKTTRNRMYKLMLKYNDEEIVSRILNQSFWIGQTASQLRDSLGKPLRLANGVMLKNLVKLGSFFKLVKIVMPWKYILLMIKLLDGIKNEKYQSVKRRKIFIRN